MSSDREQLVAKLRQDHRYMVDLMHQIKALCGKSEAAVSCDHCPANQRVLCHDNLDQLIRTFVDVTLRHNLVESACMGDDVPREHRQAHMRAHLDIAEKLKAIRFVFSENGDGILAIEGIGAVFSTLSAHLVDYDQDLEQYLLATV